MTSISAYYDGKCFVPDAKILTKPKQKVIITFLDDSLPSAKHQKSLAEIRSYMKGGKSTPANISAVDYIRSLRAED